ncbi:hypothetical protein [uncultured Lutibacter sp.]|uniref:hypothetical protein n=1 Tax=uncultured Lutibacter sp. TaxID=437739 RepID=UPI00262241D9|nr:hypothetical protein [uncultured Lutibacter sp.]
MKVYIFLIVALIYSNTFSQKVDTQYFMINEKDSLVTKLIDSSDGKISGYKIINEKKIIKKVRKPSNLTGDNIEYDAFEELFFSFNRKNDTIVNKHYIDELKILKTSREFLNLNKNFDETNTEFIFIEPKKCKNFILRKVRPIIFE